MKDDQKIFVYDMYILETKNQNNLKERIKNQYDTWLEFARQKEYDLKAAEVRAKRDKLLAESDKEMCLDRLNLKMPEEITASNLLVGIREFFEGLTNIFNGSMAKYRQELRDITKQTNFPYDVKFPDNPNTKDESEE